MNNLHEQCLKNSFIWTKVTRTCSNFKIYFSSVHDYKRGARKLLNTYGSLALMWGLLTLSLLSDHVWGKNWQILKFNWFRAIFVWRYFFGKSKILFSNITFIKLGWVTPNVINQEYAHSFFKMFLSIEFRGSFPIDIWNHAKNLH